MLQNKKNTYLFYSISFLETFVFTTAIWSFFFTSYLNFSFGEGLFLITITGIISTIFEVPSGAWADRFGRKKMFVLGQIFIIINLIFWIYANNFISFLIAGIFAGFGYALSSGNLEAIIHDELENEKNEKEFKNISSNSYILIFLGRALATAVSGIIFTINPLLPIYLTLMSSTFILILALFLKDNYQILSKHKDNISHLKESVLFLIKNNTLIMFITILGFLSGIGNVYYFTQQPYFKEIGLNIELIGLTFTIGALFSAFGSYIFKKIHDKLNDKQILNIMLLMIFISSIFMALFSIFFSIIGLVIISTMFGFLMTFGNNFLINKVNKSYKSTILSIFSLFITIGYSSFNIILSFTVDNLGLNFIYLINIFLILLLIIFNLFTFNKYHKINK